MSLTIEHRITAVEAEIDLVKEALGIIPPVVPERQNGYRDQPPEFLQAELHDLRADLTELRRQQTAAESIEIEKLKLNQLQVEFQTKQLEIQQQQPTPIFSHKASIRSQGSSGKSSPKSAGSGSGSRSGSLTPVSNDAKRYFNELNEHMEGIHGDKYYLILKNSACILQQGRTEIFRTGGDVASVRNLYIMLGVCEYNVDTFIERVKDPEFVNEERPKGSTPEMFRNIGMLTSSVDFWGRKLGFGRK